MGFFEDADFSIDFVKEPYTLWVTQYPTTVTFEDQEPESSLWVTQYPTEYPWSKEDG